MPPEQAEDDLAARLKARIAREGPLTVEAYMEACLADAAAGYYTSGQPIGEDGDFITAPEISQIFGELIGVWAIAIWQSFGAPKQITVAEIGPGRGALMADCLRIWRQFPPFREAVSVVLVETSPTLRQMQSALVSDYANEEPAIPLAWAESVDALPGGPLILIGNEFLDALPIRQFVRRGEAWRERMVGLDGDRFAFAEAQDDAEADEALRRFAQLASKGTVAETRPAIAPLIETLAARAAAAPLAALFVDYGADTPALNDTLQAVRRHAYADPLAEPGKADLTAHVDFDALKRQAAQKGLSAYGPMPQGELLLKLGLAARQEQLMQSATPDQRAMLASGANRLIDPQQMGILFKALALLSPGLPAPPPFPEERSP
ncbi:SAM-dependent methyltransferase [Methyloligella sp. 2.7D]|uniref:class I SAM-dependent methyltransferase n=1 Tax=unclassified Methyloligella TaxID=2625955 RepID=UPI00157BDE6C|nr:SAM-dependent methyltransferase [Methyloligella sp. GL2]QKP77037.1 SAM-dependent methyltransferase [Methyloligella sp. GL2]